MDTIAKRRRVVGTKEVSSSKIFTPFRSIGNVINHVPFSIGSLGTSFYIATSVGRSVQIFDAATLRLLFVSQKQTANDIACIHGYRHYIYAGYDNCLSVYKRGELLETLVCQVPNVLDDAIKITKIIQFGEYLIATSRNNYVFVFNTKEGSKYPNAFHGYIKVNDIYGIIQDVQHPATYLNKIVIATQSNIFVYNVRSLKMIFRSDIQFITDKYPGEITTMELAPVLDIIAVGTSESSIYLINIKKDKVVKKLKIDNSTKLGKMPSINTLSFRTDGSPHIAVGYNNGDLLFFDLNRGTRLHHLHAIHKQGGVSKVQFLPGQAIFVSSGNDNLLREFVFDPSLSTLDAGKKLVIPPPRHLRSRGGHSAPPVCISFASDNDHFLVSGSKDRSFWAFSLRKDSQAQEFSQRQPKGHGNDKRAGGLVGSLKEKISEMISVAFSDVRETHWENIISGHHGEKFARTWNFDNKRIGRWKLDTMDGGSASAVCISQCGNFAVVGSSNGAITIHNLQSGILRKQFKFHKQGVTGVAIDNMNQKMCSVGLDGFIGFYDFNQGKLLGKIDLDSPVTLLKYHKSSDLVAVALDDLTIVVLDMVTRRIVRQLVGHRNRITALDFSPNARWIVSSSLDGTVRTWNLPTGGCIDGFKLDNIVTNLQFSPTGNFLATTHVTGNGISLWNNQAQFKHVSTKHIDEQEFQTIIMPNTSGEGGTSLLEGALEVSKDDDGIDLSDYKSTAQIDKNLVTLSLEPRNKFTTLIHLDIIKRRHKPIAPPKKPELAPFFLQTFGEANNEADVEMKEPENSEKLITEEEENEDVLKLSKLVADSQISYETKFTKLLKASEENQEHLVQFLDYLLSLSPSNLDLEIKSLNVVADGTLMELNLLIKALILAIQFNKDYELYVAIMNLILRSHGDVIQSKLGKDLTLTELLDEWYDISEQKANKMDDLVKNCSGIIGFLSSL